jgi:hypothetical protein
MDRFAGSQSDPLIRDMGWTGMNHCEVHLGDQWRTQGVQGRQLSQRRPPVLTGALMVLCSLDPLIRDQQENQRTAVHRTVRSPKSVAKVPQGDD